MEPLVWVSGGVLLLLGAVAPVASRWRRGRQTAGAEARARSRYERLGHQIELLPAAGTTEADPAARAATLARRARERWHSTGAILAAASSPEEFQLAERTAAEGSALAEQARRAGRSRR
ncbi:hypothetical protein FHR81_004984 [Actinoalloteichus hoggarensis]|uniref:Uncharacterized protein n=1 Tax=Actinoalloteichus hoggarensis TaxID=1470176 RepID=A0A221W7X1_9PSEU|nr:hypothetical protein [Actinoalloteichus hoggarensis]ASO22008.1 hypothetical protein AHOG_21960 [Actinoalloteichus hoggarensis]MBB5923911.1 hypothetical protein [Actinoalloteichus hoggarensis]